MNNHKAELQREHRRGEQRERGGTMPAAATRAHTRQSRHRNMYSAISSPDRLALS